MHTSALRIATFQPLVILTVVGILGIGCATTQPAGRQIADSAIAAKVKTKLAADPEINPFKIDVDVNEGVVRLSGTVEKEYTRKEAEELAHRTEGVRRVENDITIGKRTLGDRVSDAGITTKIKAKITADPELNPFNINVDTEDGIVTLMGRVKSDYQKEEAEELSRNTKGVREVRNELKVGQSS